MEIVSGNLYFIADNFFEKVQEEYLKINYESTKRPHYFAFLDTCTGLYWMVPCSSKVEKFEKVIEIKRQKNKPTDSIKIVELQGKKAVLLFQDMFPVAGEYIVDEYIRGGQVVRVANPKVINDLEKTAKKICKMLHHGVRFTPTQPDIIKIEKSMLEEINPNRTI